jgi:hypothetical protein
MAAIEEGKKVRAANPWLAHVKKFRGENEGMKYKDALKGAAASYDKVVVVKREADDRRPNAWMDHVEQWKLAHPKWKETHGLKGVLKSAKETYTKVGVEAE